MTLPSDDPRTLTRRDVALLLAVALLLYGPAVWSGRPLSVHEGRLPELAREMVWQHGDWLLPTSGGRPWLERPPLPHWITAVSMMTFGRVGSLWSARLPAAMAGAGIAWLTACMAARWFGRAFGLLAGVVALSSFEIYQYATLAEDDIYLGLVAVACVAAFVHDTWDPRRAIEPPRERSVVADIVGGRPWATVLFFVLLGLTNLVKGPLVGAVPVIATIGTYLLWARDWRGLRHYAWLWGWLIFALLTVAWPLWAIRHYPDVVDNWRFDYLGQTAGDPAAAHQWDHPWWYYPAMMPLALAPWSWAALVGLVVTARRSWRARRSPQQFVWFWAVVSLLVLSAPMRKHHQYLVPVIAPWAILGAIGLVRVGEWLTPMFSWFSLRRLTFAVVGGCVVASAVVQLVVAGRDARSIAELRLLQQVKLLVPPAEPVLINADIGSLDFFRLQYMVRHEQKLIQNLSYLLDPALDRPHDYVLTRTGDRPYLESLGVVRILAEATVTERDKTSGHNFGLFELTPSAGLHRVSPPPYIGVLQAMGRAPGPRLDDQKIVTR